MTLYISASENPFKHIFTSLPKPGGGEFGKFYSLPALNDPRIGNFVFLFYTLWIFVQLAIDYLIFHSFSFLVSNVNAI